MLPAVRLLCVGALLLVWAVPVDPQWRVLSAASSVLAPSHSGNRVSMTNSCLIARDWLEHASLRCDYIEGNMDVAASNTQHTRCVPNTFGRGSGFSTAPLPVLSSNDVR